MRVQRVLMPEGSESWTVLDAGGEPVRAVESFLAHLQALDRSATTVRAYATSLKLLSQFLDRLGVAADEVTVTMTGSPSPVSTSNTVITYGLAGRRPPWPPAGSAAANCAASPAGRPGATGGGVASIGLDAAPLPGTAQTHARRAGDPKESTVHTGGVAVDRAHRRKGRPR